MFTDAFTAADVKALRTKLGMSQQAFATEIHAGIRTVASWESGKTKKMSHSLRQNCLKLKKKADRNG